MGSLYTRLRVSHTRCFVFECYGWDHPHITVVGQSALAVRGRAGNKDMRNPQCVYRADISNSLRKLRDA